MHILVWHEAYVPGGGDRSLVDLIEHWPDGSDQFTVALNDTHPRPDILSGSGARLVLYRSIRDVARGWQGEKSFSIIAKLTMVTAAIRRIVALVNHVNPDAGVMNNGGYPGGSSHYCALVALRLRGIRPRVMIVRNFPGPQVRRHRLRCAGLVLRRCATDVVAVSESLANMLRQQVGFPSHCLTVIPNGVAKPSAALLRRGAARIRVVALIGSVEVRKGHEVLLRAVSYLKDLYPDLRLVFTGQSVSPDREHLDAIVVSLGLCDRVEWRGFNADIDSVFKGVDLVVMPSVAQESFGRVAAEAMARAIPIIVSDCGGLPEVVEDGVTGLVFPSGNATALAEAIARIVDNTSLRECLITGGRHAYSMKYNAERMAHDYYRLLHGTHGKDSA